MPSIEMDKACDQPARILKDAEVATLRHQRIHLYKRNRLELLSSFFIDDDLTKATSLSVQ